MINAREDIETYLFSKLLTRWNNSARRDFNYIEAMGCCVDALNQPDVSTSGMTYAEGNAIIHNVCNLMNDYVKIRKELI